MGLDAPDWERRVRPERWNLSLCSRKAHCYQREVEDELNIEPCRNRISPAGSPG
jgi:hypothetical protein